MHEPSNTGTKGKLADGAVSVARDIFRNFNSIVWSSDSLCARVSTSILHQKPMDTIPHSHTLSLLSSSSSVIVFLQYITLKISGESLHCITSFIFMLLPLSSVQIFSLAVYCTECSVKLRKADSLCVAALESCDCVSVCSFSSTYTNIVDSSKLFVKIRANTRPFGNIRPFENIPSCNI